MNEKRPINEKHLKYYKFLEVLRKIGETNMFGAAPYLRAHFGLSAIEANTILVEWMDNYDEINSRWDLRNNQQLLQQLQQSV